MSTYRGGKSKGLEAGILCRMTRHQSPPLEPSTQAMLHSGGQWGREAGRHYIYIIVSLLHARSQEETG